MSGHTPGPWLLSDLTIYTLRHSKWAGLDTWENAWSATVQPDGQHKTPVHELEANAARIVACVNALEGLDPAAVADVVAALERCLNYVTNTESALGITLECGDLARTALARIRGEG